MNFLKTLRGAAIAAAMLALCVVMLGAYTRLTDAGLGCPDWPGCYGHLVLPSQGQALVHAQDQYPEIPIEAVKAWTEMAHRYMAGTLVCLVVFLAWGAQRLRLQGVRVPWVGPVFLLFLLGLQATLGMWTVTLKLLPVVVMGHLLGGVLIFVSLVYYAWQLSVASGLVRPLMKRPLPLWFFDLGLLIIFIQMALGGWVSSNYAGISCIGFPLCNGQGMPHLLLAKAFNLFSHVGANYQGGLLEPDVRASIQWVHRIGAYVTVFYLVLITTVLWWRTHKCVKFVRNMAFLVLLLLMTQFVLGVMNVIYLLPLWVAVAHNGVAALLLGTWASLRYMISTAPRSIQCP